MVFERWHPVTSDLGLIRATVPSCVASFEEWHASIGLRYTTTRASTFPDALVRLQPLSAELRRKAFVPTASEPWTAFFASGVSGSDPAPIMSVLASRMGVLAMRVCVTPPKATWPAVIWEVYAPQHLGGAGALGYRRSLAASKDGGRWVFEQSGAPYPFELTDAYTRPRKRDRFTQELLGSYLDHFGLAPFADEFYQPTPANPAVVLERVSGWTKIPEEFTIEQALARGV